MAMLSNGTLLNAIEQYVAKLRTENADLKAKLRKAANDILSADSMRVAANNNLENERQETGMLRKINGELRAQVESNNAVISSLRKHNMELHAECERLRQTVGYTGVPMSIQLDGETFQNNEDGLKAFVSAVQRAERKDFKDTLDHYAEQLKALSAENQRLETNLRSAENALKEKDSELEALRTRITDNAKCSVDPQPSTWIATCTPHQYAEIRKSIQRLEDHLQGLIDQLMD